jgi:hypothetical protein
MRISFKKRAIKSRTVVNGYFLLFSLLVLMLVLLYGQSI